MKLSVKCEQCGESFLKLKKEVTQSIKRGWKFYCCYDCRIAAKTTSVECECSYCHKSITKQKSWFERHKGSLPYCSHKCARANMPNECFPSGENHVHWKGGKTTYRQKAIEYYGAKCSICGYSVESCLEVHHKDHNRRHNKIENLDVLCPTHHTEYQKGVRIYPSSPTAEASISKIDS